MQPEVDLAAVAAALGVTMDAKAERRLLAYLELLNRWNRTYNLTAIRDPAQMLAQHVADSMAVLPPLRRHLQDRSTSLLDVGSGGGLPGVVLAALDSRLQVTCIDAVAKKVAFLKQVRAELELENLQAVHARVESFDGQFDVVASRAFASLIDFTHWTAHCLSRQGGVWMALKGRIPDDEIAALPGSVDVFHVEPLEVPGLAAQRCVVWMRPR